MSGIPIQTPAPKPSEAPPDDHAAAQAAQDGGGTTAAAPPGGTAPESEAAPAAPASPAAAAAPAADAAEQPPPTEPLWLADIKDAAERFEMRVVSSDVRARFVEHLRLAAAALGHDVRVICDEITAPLENVQRGHLSARVTDGIHEAEIWIGAHAPS